MLKNAFIEKNVINSTQKKTTELKWSETNRPERIEWS